MNTKLSVATLLFIILACGPITEPDVLIDPPQYVLSVLGGDQQSDTVLSALPAPFSLLLTTIEPELGAGRPVGHARVIVTALAEECGTPDSGNLATDDDGRLDIFWTLNQVAGECTVGLRAIADEGSGAGADAEVRTTTLAGQPRWAWIAEPGSRAAADSLDLETSVETVTDDYENPLVWSLVWVSGPVFIREPSGSFSGSSYVVIPTSAGSGTINLMTSYGLLASLDVDVCTTPEGLTVRLFRRDMAGTPPPSFCSP